MRSHYINCKYNYVLMFEFSTVEIKRSLEVLGIIVVCVIFSAAMFIWVTHLNRNSL